MPWISTYAVNPSKTETHRPQKNKESHAPLSLIEIFVDKRTRKGLDTKVCLDVVDHMIAALDDLSTATPEALVLVGATS